jgi:hypothetical protein
MKAAGQTPPAAVPVRGLIDTGASCTCIDPSIVNQLKLQATGNVSVTTPSTGAAPHPCQQYDVSLTFILPLLAFTVGAAPVVECPLINQGFHLLIGRDILSHCFFAYDGRAGTFVLAF